MSSSGYCLPESENKIQPQTHTLVTCVVCMEKLENHEEHASLACGHHICLNCLYKVQNQSSTHLCPLCRPPLHSNSNLGLDFAFRDTLGNMELGSSGLFKYTEQGSEQIQETRDKKKKLEVSTFHKSQPDVNMWNVLGGIMAIASRKAKSYINQTIRMDNINKEVETSKDLWTPVYLPSAPPLLTAPGEDVKAIRMTLDAERPQWIPDSVSRTCMQCNANFQPLIRGRHHCRFCGGIFCGACSRGKCLLPLKFMDRTPQRVCDACYERLDPIQVILVNTVSNATQTAIHDVTDWSCMRGWLNSPLGLSMEQEIYKATNTLLSFCKIGRIKPEKCIPDIVLRGAQGLAILTVVRTGAIMTYKLGTGLVVARRRDGTWSGPSAILSCGLGWGAQIGGELTDFVIVLNTSKAVNNFSGRLHFSVGAGISAAAGPLGRTAEADLHVGSSGTAACYSYSCSKGAFVGVSLESNLIAARVDTNACFYGDPYLTPVDILLGGVASPRAAAPLYSALEDLFQQIKPEKH